MAALAEGHPVTRAELREELQHYATKADLERITSDIIWWALGVMFAGLTAAVGLTAVVVRVVGG